MAQRSKHITVLVSNDLQFDQRVAKVCETLRELGLEITLVGRLLPGSTTFERPYKTRRFRLLFHRGAMFYAALNIRIFFYLLFKRTDIILANDLDTLLPAFIISKLKGVQLVYDSHEYFTEAEGLTGRNFQKKTWESIERFCFSRLKYVYTVNDSIAKIYSEKYGVDVKVVRNIPVLHAQHSDISRSELSLPVDKKIILLQGAYIDPDRGGEELIDAMNFLPDVMLLIIGSGRAIPELKNRTEKSGLSERIIFKNKMPFTELRKYTATVDLGLSLDKPLHLNYTLSLPNKLFDYIHAGTPVLVSDLPELRKIVDQYQIGMISSGHRPDELAENIKTALQHPNYAEWKSNCKNASEVLNWQNESKVILNLFTEVISNIRK